MKREFRFGLLALVTLMVALFACKKEDPIITVTGVTLSKPTLTLTEGESETITATVTPSDAANKKVTWSSSKSEVATVDGGKITAVSPGSAVITVKSDDGGKSASCTVTVEKLPDTKAPVVSNSKITLVKIMAHSVNIKWEEATDEETPQSELEYKVEVKLGDNRSTLVDWSKGLNNILWSAAKARKIYTFYVSVRDEAGNEASYDPYTITTLGAVTVGEADKTVMRGTFTGSINVTYPCNVTGYAAGQFTLPSSPIKNLPSTVSLSSTVVEIDSNGDFDLVLSVSDKAPAMNVGNMSLTLDGEIYSGSFALEVDHYKDLVPPTISNKEVTIYNVSPKGFYMSWEEASDNDTPANKLQYSTLITFVGELIYETPWRSNVTSLVYQDLNPEHTYLVSLRVRDEAGNISEYNSVAVTTPAKPEPTDIGYTNRYIYTWPGNSVDLGVVLTPSDATYRGVRMSSMTYDPYFISADGNLRIHDDRVELTPRVADGISGKGMLVTNAASVEVNLKLDNGKTTTITVRTKFAVVISTNATMKDNRTKINQNFSYSWPKSSGTKMYIRSYYGANETEWQRANTVDVTTYLSSIPTNKYDITSSDPAITIKKSSDGQTWELTRTSESVLKEVVLTITCGIVEYEQVIVLTN